VLRCAALDADRGAAADVIEEVVAVEDFLQPEEGQQPAIEGPRLLPLADGQDDVRHAVHFDHFRAPASCAYPVAFFALDFHYGQWNVVGARRMADNSSVHCPY